MVASTVLTERPPAWARPLKHLPVLIGLAIMGVPTLITLGQQVWSTEAGAHGPIVLATGAWLLARQADELRDRATPSNHFLTALMVAASLALYVFGRAYDFISLEVAGFYGACISVMYSYFGLSVLIRNWFPLLYLGFCVPPPGWLIDSVTAPLKEFVSFAATGVLQLIGVPVFREGVTLTVAQYQLLVEDACSGMNSLIGLVAISLFYIYLLRNASWGYSLLLVVLVVPIAIVANIVRIIVLVLLTYFMGDAVAQGFLHTTAGLFLFATALVLVFAVDHLLSSLFKPKAAKA
jgi:exosortase